MKKGYLAERERQIQLEKEGWHVTRNSGSIGASDLIAVRSATETLFDVRYEQVKSTKDKTFYFDKRTKDEIRRLFYMQTRLRIPCYLSIKFKRRGWLIININDLNDFKPIKWK